MKTLGLIFFVIIICILSTMWTGFATFLLWGWFLVPLGVTKITFPMAMGIGVIISFLTTTTLSNKNDEEELFDQFMEEFFKEIARPLMAIVFGFVIQLFV